MLCLYLYFISIGAIFAGFLFKELFIGHQRNDFWQDLLYF